MSLSTKDGSLKLLTFNLWGLKYVSKCRTERITAFAKKLRSQPDYDVVALQEIWTDSDWDIIVETCGDVYPYTRKFSSGILTGPGLAILSKVPIKRTFLYRFPVNGTPAAFYRGDWYVGKAVAITLLEPLYDGASPIALLNSHMHAPYALTGSSAYACVRACQAWEIASIVQTFTEAGYAVILVGDLNSRPGSLPYRILESEACLTDSWEEIHGATILEKLKQMTPEDQILLGGATCDSTLNTWRADRRPDEACRLDYALIDRTKLRVVDASVQFTDKIPGIGSYSDHFAYTATMNVLPRSLKTPGYPDRAVRLGVYQELSDLVAEYLRSNNYWRSWLRIAHFWVSVWIFIGCLAVIVVVSFVAPWSSILFMLLGSLSLATGLLDGQIGFLFGRNERRALQEVILQVKDATNVLQN
ncbi:hypothetical protein OGAPHI_002425 [Ogataea philodendri]|uniref:Endonuclease/exonuclease/phosphatase domain-containing protein n=1 Tax=Ogataea philodendri TaxID=1378263 RepID=A0A9P8T7B0_9ASCO|nr:uncharacterized protein OGAPHI_002425 [Ogataea philodendri]KAH3668671.1 hypothetical protein OGAPHI_002425 [Ogataea philodendri]